MNNLQRQRLMTNLPKDSGLEGILHDSIIDSDQALYDKIKSWVNWKKFFLIITVLFYAIYYYAKNKQQESRNIFKAISQSSTQLKLLKQIIEGNTHKKEMQKPSEDDIPNQESEDSSASYESPTATSKALKSKRPQAIKFENNAVICFRLSDGNFLVQHQNYDIHIIDPHGKKITDLHSKEPNTKHIIYAITELSDGTIITAGQIPDLSGTVLQLYHNQKISHSYKINVKHVTQIDSHGKMIALTCSSANGDTVQILEVTNQNIKLVKTLQIYQHHTPSDIVMLSNNLVACILKNQEDKATQSNFIYLCNIETNEIKSIECHASNLTRGFQNQLIFSDKSTTKAHLRIHDTSLKLLFEGDVVEHSHAISNIATSPNSQFLVTADWNGQIILWNCQTFDIIKSFDTELFTIANLFVNDQGEISVTEGELKDFNPTLAHDGQLTIPAIHFYNRSAKSHKTTHLSEEHSQYEATDNPALTR